jgi:multidrug efflux pump subunit AcrA (membrane-fusion protein)
MSSPLFSTTGAASGAGTWQELEDVLAGLGQLARSRVPPERFYSTLLDECVRALSAVGGAVWLRAPGGALRPVAQIRWPGAEFAADDESRRAHEALLTAAATRGEAISIGPHSARSDAASDDAAGHDADPAAGNPTDHVLLLGPVQLAIDDTSSPDSRLPAPEPSTLAIIEILQRADASPAAYRGYEQFLSAVCELAADFHAYSELGRLRSSENRWQQLLRLSAEVQRIVELQATVDTVANDGRRVVGCDRLNVLVARGRHVRLLGTSGVGRIERRSGAARRLEQLGELVRRTGEAAYYTDGQSDAHLPIAEALEKHADESHARQVAAIPLARLADPANEHGDRPTRAKQDLPAIVLVAEQFDAEHGNLDRQRLAEVGEVCATALYNALDFDRLPLSGLWRWLGAVKHQVVTHLSRTAMIVVGLAALVAALVFVDTDFTIEAPGTLQPTVRRDVFAPRGGLVDEVLVAHGNDVEAGQPLVRLRDPSLEHELKRVTGEMETVRRQLDAVRASKTSRDVRDTTDADLYRMSAGEREFAQRLENLRRELELLTQERERLVVRSPIAGRVLTWDVADRLIARPVERGEVLVTVADLSGDWQLEVEVPDDQIGHVMAARKKLQPDLPVRYRLRAEDDAKHVGHIEEISTTADVQTEAGSSPAPRVLVRVALDTSELTDAVQGDLRPGLSARAQIECGRRSIGYVWLHDVWDTVVGWLKF